MSESPVKPIFLLADSQLLFWRNEKRMFLDRVVKVLEQKPSATSAAYVGASNDDRPEFYELFVAAMAGIQVRDCRMIPSAPSEKDWAFLDQADIILLAGGEVERGWDLFCKIDLDKRIIARYYAGAILIGVSAGAVQLGLRGWREASRETFVTFQLVPFAIDVHDGPEWQRLRQVTLQLGENGRGLGIPSGGGAIYYPDWSVEPVRRPLTEFTVHDDGVKQTLLFPSDSSLFNRSVEAG